MKTANTWSLMTLALSLIFIAPATADIIVSINPLTQSVKLGSAVSFAVDISGLGSGTALGSYDISIGFENRVRLTY